MARLSPKKFAHVVYRTYRFDQMIAWYQNRSEERRVGKEC